MWVWLIALWAWLQGAVGMAGWGVGQFNSGVLLEVGVAG